MTIVNKYRIADVKRELEKSVVYACSTLWGMNLPWDQMYIAGGCIASHLQHQKPKDIDIYFETEDAMQEAFEELLKYKDFILDVDEKYRDVLGKDGKMITEWAVTMKTGHSFIIKKWGSPAEVKATFDFLHCTSHYDISNNKLYISEAVYAACINKKLVVHSVANYTAAREARFMKRGYTY